MAWEDKIMNSYWVCDTCGEKILSSEDGLLEWYSAADEKGVLRRGNLRLVHGLAASPLKRLNLKRNGCEFDVRRGYIRSEGDVDSRPLREFLGPDGLVRLLSLLSGGEFSVDEVVKMIQRLHVPGFEMAREFFRAATYAGILEPDSGDGHCNQRDIEAALKWQEGRKAVA